ncbi:MAG: hypothetical protein JXJ04_05495 [Spirochaetales bacterium]|nr:hypothetical protein [Spirochaetales bacterium]
MSTPAIIQLLQPTMCSMLKHAIGGSFSIDPYDIEMEIAASPPAWKRTERDSGNGFACQLPGLVSV